MREAERGEAESWDAHNTCTTCVYYVRRFEWRCPRVECCRLLALVGAVTVEALAADAHLDDEHPLYVVSE